MSAIYDILQLYFEYGTVTLEIIEAASAHMERDSCSLCVLVLFLILVLVLFLFLSLLAHADTRLRISKLPATTKSVLSPDFCLVVQP